MPVREELKSYAAKLGFPDSETMGAIFAILYDDEDSVKLAARGSCPRETITACILR